MRHVGNRRAVRGVWVTSAVSITLVVAGCGDSQQDTADDKASPTPSVSTSASDSVASAAKRDVLAVVKNMYEAGEKMLTTGREKGTGLRKYAGDKALAHYRKTLYRYQQAGVVMRGKAKHTDTRVTALDLSSSPKRATVQSCLDTTGVAPVKKDSGEEVDVGKQPRRYVVTETVRTVGGEWLVVNHELDKERSC